MSGIPKEGTLNETPAVFKSWSTWYWVVIFGNILFCLWMVLYFSKFN